MKKEVSPLVGLGVMLFAGVVVITTIFYKQAVLLGEVPMPAQEPQQAALIQTVAAPSPAPSPSVAISEPQITPGLLPQVNIPSPKTTGKTTGKTAATTTIKTIAKNSPAKNPATSTQKTATTQTAPTAPAPAAATALTAQSLLAATTLSFIENLDGPYKMVLTTNAGTAGTVTWSLGDATIGGNGSLPKFSVAYSCSPIPNLPIVGATDLNPTFDVRTSYNCTVSLTPLSGKDQTTQSKQFSFTTPVGAFIVTAPSSMNTVLQSGQNDGGFVFNNEDSRPVAVNSVKLDVTYTGLIVAYGPLVLRITDPTTGLPVAADYHLENLAADPSRPYTYTGTDIQIPLSFTIGPASQKMLPLQVLGVHWMSISGVDPTMTITLRDVATDQSGGKTIVHPAVLSWSCTVATVAYDPNATSGVFASGEVCR
jgi:hypothetical protein